MERQRGAGEQQGTGGNLAPSLSRDGRYVAFASAATILVAGDTAYVESAQACGLHLLSGDAEAAVVSESDNTLVRLVNRLITDAIEKAAKSRYGVDTDVRAEIDGKTGEIRLQRLLEVVETPEDFATQIALEDDQAHGHAPHAHQRQQVRQRW